MPVMSLRWTHPEFGIILLVPKAEPWFPVFCDLLEDL